MRGAWWEEQFYAGYASLAKQTLDTFVKTIVHTGMPGMVPALLKT
jgi:hypothetical protein